MVKKLVLYWIKVVGRDGKPQHFDGPYYDRRAAENRCASYQQQYPDDKFIVA